MKKEILNIIDKIQLSQNKIFITHYSRKQLENFQIFFDIESNLSDLKHEEDDYYRLEYKENNALDLLGKLKEFSADIIDKINTFGNYAEPFSFKVAKTKENAVIPSKTHTSDTGYDLTIIDIVKEIGNVTLYDTGIKVSPSFGWYFDVVPRSSIIKSGYILANSVGVIDSQYKNSIMIGLVKIDQTMPDIELPMRIAQLIPRQRTHAEPIVVNEKGLGGFGSTN